MCLDVRASSAEVIDSILTIVHNDDVVRDMGTAEASFNQTGVTAIVFNQMDRHGASQLHGIEPL